MKVFIQNIKGSKDKAYSFHKRFLKVRLLELTIVKKIKDMFKNTIFLKVSVIIEGNHADCVNFIM